MDHRLYDEISFALRMLPIVTSINAPHPCSLDQWHSYLKRVADDINIHGTIYWYSEHAKPDIPTVKVFIGYKCPPGKNIFDRYDIV
jgi:hypothetical protein